MTDREIFRLRDGILSGDRTVLSQAITLVESKRLDHRRQALELLESLQPNANSIRLGLTGAPGVGKSTTIDALGEHIAAQEHTVAVLAVDPTSNRTGGSILGDKTRMHRLAVNPKVFIRPSPSSGTLGGIAARTREVMLLCEAAGFDVVIVETVGIGQSEVAVNEMVDFFCVLALPGAGDDLQGIKKGVLELADMIAVNKADGDNATRAERAASDYKMALHILTANKPDWQPPVMTLSGLTGLRVPDLWDEVLKYRATMQANGYWQEHRQQQRMSWMWSIFDDTVRQAINNRGDVHALAQSLEASVRSGETQPASAAAQLIAALGIER